MIKQTVFFFLFSFISFSTTAQISETYSPMSKGEQNGYVLEIEGQHVKEVEKAWMKFVQRWYKTKKAILDKKSKEIFANDLVIEGMSANSVDAYARVFKKDGYIELIVWYDLGGAFLSSQQHRDRYGAAFEMLEKFDLQMKQELAKNDIGIEKKQLKVLSKEYNALQKDHRKIETKLLKLEEEIAVLRQQLRENETIQIEKEHALREQEKNIESAKQKYRGIK